MDFPISINWTSLLRHKDGQDGRGESFIGRSRYALTMLPGKNNARNYEGKSKITEPYLIISYPHIVDKKYDYLL